MPKRTHVTFCLHPQTLDCSVQMDLSVLNLIPVSCKIVLAPPYIYFGAGRKEAHIKEYSGWCGLGWPGPGPARRAIICLRGYNTASVALLFSIKSIITSSLSAVRIILSSLTSSVSFSSSEVAQEDIPEICLYVSATDRTLRLWDVEEYWQSLDDDWYHDSVQVDIQIYLDIQYTQE